MGYYLYHGGSQSPVKKKIYSDNATQILPRKDKYWLVYKVNINTIQCKIKLLHGQLALLFEVTFFIYVLQVPYINNIMTARTENKFDTYLCHNLAADVSLLTRALQIKLKRLVQHPQIYRSQSNQQSNVDLWHNWKQIGRWTMQQYKNKINPK